MLYKEVKEEIKQNAIRLVPKDKIGDYIFPFKELKDKLEKGFDFKGIPIQDLKVNPEQEVIFTSTLDTEVLEEDLMSDKNYHFLYFGKDNNPEVKEVRWSGLTLYFTGDYMEIYDDTCGLHFSIFLLF